MAEAPVIGARKGTIKLDDAVFGGRFHGPLVHESVRAELNARRRGTASTLTRGKVSGGGAKPWRQKGTGRARAGSNRSPIWAGGGIAFGPQPRSYAFKVNRKERRAALRSALSLHAERGSVAVLDAGGLDEPKTQRAAKLLSAWGQPLPALVVLGADEATAALSFRNLERVRVLAVDDVGVADVLWAASLVVSEAALEDLAARATPPRERGSAAAAPATARPATKPAAKAGAAAAKSAAQASGGDDEAPEA